MMKKLVALLMALALLCSSIGALAEVDEWGYTSIESLDEYTNHTSCSDVVKSDAGRADKEATCAAPAYVWSRCAGHKVRFWKPVENSQIKHTSDQLPESYTEFVYQKATCNAPGGIGRKCTVCGTEGWVAWTIPADPDNHAKLVSHGQETAPTCYTKGTTKYWCEGCEKWVYIADINELTHTKGTPVRTEPTTTKAGYIKTFCAHGCNYEFEEDRVVLAPIGFTEDIQDFDVENEAVKIPLGEGNNGIHAYGFPAKSNVYPTDCAPATLRYYCVHCQNVIDVTVSGNHEASDEYIAAGKITVEEVVPDCLNPGTRKFVGECSKCHTKNLTWYQTIKAQGHLYTEANLVEEVEATCGKAGYKVYRCTRTNCPNEDHLVKVVTEEAKKHDWTTEPQSYIDKATCVKGGSYGSAIVCKICGAIKEGSENNNTVVDALDHQAVLDKLVEDGLVYKTETVEGKKVVKYVGSYTDGQVIAGDKKYLTPGDEKSVYAAYGDCVVTYKPATCEDEGRITIACKDCDAKIDQVLSPLGHEYKYEEAIKDYDCTKSYSMMVYCKYYETCGYSTQITIPALSGHNFDEDNVIGYAQRLPGGALKKYYGDDAFDNIHPCEEYYEIIGCTNLDPTDRLYYECTAEKLVLKEATEDHKIDNSRPHSEKPATCLEDGVRCYECEKCHNTVVEPIYAEGHKMTNGRVLTAATCTEKGEREIYCSVCGDADKATGKVYQSVAEKEGVQTAEIPTISHVFAYHEENAACKTNVSYWYCVMCGMKKDETITSGHVPGNDLQTIKAATCTEKGKRSFTCQICHQFITEETSALGHSYQRIMKNGVQTGVKSIAQAQADHVQYECKFAQGSGCETAKCLTDEKHVLVCTDPNCKEKLTWTVDDTAIGEHTIFKGVDTNGKPVLCDTFTIVQVPTCESAGYAMYNCPVCGSFERYDLAKLPHNLKAQYDDEKNTFYFSCEPIYNTNQPGEGKDGLDRLFSLISNAYKDECVGAAVYAKITQLTGDSEKIGYFGEDDHIIEITAKEPEYTVSKTSETRGKIVLKDEDMYDLYNPYVRITWRYTLGNGDTISFVTTREVSLVSDDAGDYGTFKLTGLSVPEDAVCNFIYVEVVTDPDADELYAGQYDTYGKAAL